MRKCNVLCNYFFSPSKKKNIYLGDVRQSVRLEEKAVSLIICVALSSVER